MRQRDLERKAKKILDPFVADYRAMQRRNRRRITRMTREELGMVIARAELLAQTNCGAIEYVFSKDVVHLARWELHRRSRETAGC